MKKKLLNLKIPFQSFKVFQSQKHISWHVAWMLQNALSETSSSRESQVFSNVQSLTHTKQRVYVYEWNGCYRTTQAGYVAGRVTNHPTLGCMQSGASLICHCVSIAVHLHRHVVRGIINMSWCFLRCTATSACCQGHHSGPGPIM